MTVNELFKDIYSKTKQLKKKLKLEEHHPLPSFDFKRYWMIVPCHNALSQALFFKGTKFVDSDFDLPEKKFDRIITNYWIQDVFRSKDYTVVTYPSPELEDAIGTLIYLCLDNKKECTNLNFKFAAEGWAV